MISTLLVVGCQGADPPASSAEPKTRAAVPSPAEQAPATRPPKAATPAKPKTDEAEVRRPEAVALNPKRLPSYTAKWEAIREQPRDGVKLRVFGDSMLAQSGASTYGIDKRGRLLELEGGGPPLGVAGSSRQLGGWPDNHWSLAQRSAGQDKPIELFRWTEDGWKTRKLIDPRSGKSVEKLDSKAEYVFAASRREGLLVAAPVGNELRIARVGTELEAPAPVVLETGQAVAFDEAPDGRIAVVVMEDSAEELVLRAEGLCSQAACREPAAFSAAPVYEDDAVGTWFRDKGVSVAVRGVEAKDSWMLAHLDGKGWTVEKPEFGQDWQSLCTASDGRLWLGVRGGDEPAILARDTEGSWARVEVPRPKPGWIDLQTAVHEGRMMFIAYNGEDGYELFRAELPDPNQK